MRLTIVLLFIATLFHSNLEAFSPDMSEFAFKKDLPINCCRFHSNIKWDGHLDDVYFYDVQHYDIALDVTDTTNFNLSGSVNLIAKTTKESFDEIIFDLHDALEITAITYTGGTYSNYQLSLTTEVERVGMRTYVSIPEEIGLDEEFSIFIEYNGAMISEYTSNGWYINGLLVDEYNGKVNLYTLSEPEESRYWWPNKNLPGDKSTVDMDLTVWDYQFGSGNGTLVETVTNGDKKTYRWEESYPVANYLVAIAVYPYEIIEDSYTSLDGSKTMPVEYYMFPGQYQQHQTNVDKTPDMMVAFAERFGEYPFIDEKYAMVSMAQSGGMEHQTVSTMGGYYERVIVHELAHMWFGDQITCKTWNDTWINEGGATYLEAIWEEAQYGSNALQSYMLERKPNAMSSLDPLNNQEYALTGLIYYKGAWVYHMLRSVLGDDQFFNNLNTILNDSPFSYGNATGEEYINYLGDLSGLDLSYFWDQWINHGGYPEYTLAKRRYTTGTGSIVDIQIGQEQTITSKSVPYFKMPIELKFSFQDGTDSTLVVENDALAIQNFNIVFDDKVVIDGDFVELDPNNWILCNKRDVNYLSIEEELVANPKIHLSKNYPNPFNNQTQISFISNYSSNFKFFVYNQAGQEVYNKNFSAEKGAENSLTFNADKFNSGVYFYQIVDQSKGIRSSVRKMLYVK